MYQRGINLDIDTNRERSEDLIGEKKEKCTMKRLIKTATLRVRRGGGGGGDVEHPFKLDIQ